MHNKIYSRKRIKLPHFIRVANNKKSENAEKLIRIFFVLIIAFSIVKIALDAVNPIFDTLCEDEAKGLATKITNEQATKVMQKYSYEDLFIIEKDEDGNISMIKSNVFPINQIISDVAIYVQNEIDNLERDDIKIALGSFTGMKLLSGRGPDVKIKISSIGNIDTDLKSEFISQGINQTLHRVYLQLECKMNILTPFDRIEKDISNQILIAENVIVGKIPSTYYNLEGFKNETDTLELIE